MSTLYDQKLYEDMLKDHMSKFAELLETYIQQEDFTHPGFYALLREMDPPHDLMLVVTKMGERLEVKGCAPDYYAMINRTITERLYPFLVAYHKGLATESQAIFAGEERDKRTKIIKSKSWKKKVKEMFSGDEEEDGDDDTTDIE